MEAAEQDIDRAFRANGLLNGGSSKQAIWTVLSVAEDLFLKHAEVMPLDDDYMPVAIDNLINQLAYPLRECFRHWPKLDGQLDRRYIPEDYQLAVDWLLAADDYGNFCSIFPLWRRGKIELGVQDRTLATPNWSLRDPAYEAYNRLVPKDGVPAAEVDSRGHESVLRAVRVLIRARLTASGTVFSVKFDRRLVEALLTAVESISGERYTLPDQWPLDGFTFGDFRRTFATVQAMAYGWYLGRSMAARSGLRGLGYDRAVLMMSRHELQKSIVRYSGVSPTAADAILGLLTFGAAGVREPDIAVQPLVVFADGTCAVSPFVWLNSHAERNFCVLLNLVPRQQALYSKLTQEKEGLLREEVRVFLLKERPDLEVRHGRLAQTDIDLAVLNRAERVCVCAELKWFIEPAEIRETLDRSKELTKGVSQAKRIAGAFACADPTLFRLLEIDASWTFMTVVAPRNWIGHFDVQDHEIPIVKTLHLAHEIARQPSLTRVVEWLRQRQYLPELNSDFTVPSVEITCGDWRSSWYGIKPGSPDTEVGP